MSLRAIRERPKSFYAAVTSGLSAAQKRRVEEIFDRLEIKQDGRVYRIGHIIKAAWQAEDALPQAAAAEVSKLIRAVLEGSVSQYALPACCRWHRLALPAAFNHSATYPDDNELLWNLSQLIWTLLPHLRGELTMCCQKGRRLLTSRFMDFENFVERHDREVVVGERLLADAARDYAYDFRPSRNSALRQSELRKRLVAGELCGMIGAPNDNAGFGIPHYCDQCRPFSTPDRPGSRERSNAPDRQLSRLGLQFSRGQRFVELLYRVEISTREAAAGPAAAAPSVVDAGGYWLFHPDRALSRSGQRWNHARDLQTNRRGSRELIAGPSALSSLADLIVWPQPTNGSWVTIAAPELAKDNLV